MEALTRDSRRLSTTSMNTKRTFLLCRKADISTWGLHCCEGNIHIPPFLSDTEDGIVGAELHAGLEVTKRQIEILSLMDEGHSNQEIAEKLFISRSTVKTHVNHLFKVFTVNNRINCLRAAKKAGVLMA